MIRKIDLILETGSDEYEVGKYGVKQIIVEDDCSFVKIKINNGFRIFLKNEIREIYYEIAEHQQIEEGIMIP